MDSQATTFPRFQLLPTELRLLIWEQALPDTTSPILFHYDRHDGFDGPSQAKVTQSFSRTFKISLATINHKSRNTVLNWAETEERGVRLSGTFVQPTLTQFFDERKDVLYFSGSFFANDYETSLFPQFIDALRGDSLHPRYIAISAAGCLDRFTYLAVISTMLLAGHRWPDFKTLFIVLELSSSIALSSNADVMDRTFDYVELRSSKSTENQTSCLPGIVGGKSRALMSERTYLEAWTLLLKDLEAWRLPSDPRSSW